MKCFSSIVNRGLLIVSIIAWALSLQAQDVHFSQFYASPILINPAFTGLINADARVIANYRSQWGSIATPFRTMSLTADFTPFRHIFGDDMFGAGLVLLNDRAGEADLQHTEIQIPFAYSKSINGQSNHYVSLGGQVGFVQQRLDVNKLTFDSQYDGDAIDLNRQSGEMIDNSQSSYYDFSAGVAWSYTPERFSSFFAGFSMAHLNSPNISLISDNEDFLSTRLSAYAGAEFRAAYYLSILPRFLYMKQGPHSEITAGALAKFIIGEANEGTAFYLGTLHRVRDAQAVITRFDYGPFGLSFSYDFTISKLGKATRGNGAMEIALIYHASFRQGGTSSRPVRCPSF